MGESVTDFDRMLAYELKDFSGVRWVVVRIGTILFGYEHYALLSAPPVPAKDEIANPETLTEYARAIWQHAGRVAPGVKVIVIIPTGHEVGDPRYGVDWRGQAIIGTVGTHITNTRPA